MAHRRSIPIGVSLHTGMQVNSHKMESPEKNRVQFVCLYLNVVLATLYPIFSSLRSEVIRRKISLDEPEAPRTELAPLAIFNARIFANGHMTS